MIRVAGLHDQVEAGITDKRRAGLNPSETIDALRARIQPQLERQARMVDDELRPGSPSTASASSASTRCPTTSGRRCVSASSARSCRS